MNVVEKIKGWVKGIFAGYQLFSYDRDRSRVPGSLESARYDMPACDREEMMRRFRHWEKKNPMMQGMLRVHETYTVGNGLQVSPNSADAEWNKTAKMEFEKWAEDCELSCEQNLATSQALWSRRVFIDGDVGVNLTVNERKEPRIQTIEGHLIKTPPDQRKNKRFIDGAFCDLNGRPMQWYVEQEGEDGKPYFGPPLSARRFILIKETERAAQVRGMTVPASSHDEIHDLYDLHKAEMRNAKNNADVANVIETENGEIPSLGAIVRNRVNGSTTLNDGTQVTSTSVDYVQSGIGGRTIGLKKGEKLSQFRTENPSAATREYWKLKSELGTMGGDIPFILVFPHSVQGTVARGTLDTAAATFESKSDIYAAATIKVYRYWLEWAVKNIPALKTKPADYTAATVSRPRKPNVDIGYNANATIEELKHGITNFDLIYGPRGQDWRVELPKLEKQLETVRQQCPNLAGLLFANLANVPAPEEPGETADGEGEVTPEPKKKPDPELQEA